jgi:hypothetical protein
MITAHIATIPEREESLRKVLNAISPQVDKTYVSLNSYQVKPDWIDTFHKVCYTLCDNSFTDGAKWLHVNDEPSICVILDDDLIVSPGFVNYMLQGLYNFGGAVSLHGKRYDKRPILRYRRSYTANCRCLGTCETDMPVHVIGTGCTLFDNRRIKLDQSVYEYPSMADVLFSRFCTYNNIPMTVLKHKAGQYLTYIPPLDGKTIWRSTTDDTIQTEIIKSFLK